jgi:hypothetical protein
MRGLAILCAVVNLCAIGFVAWLMWFAALYPSQNIEPEERTANDWLVPVAVVLLASAAGLLFCVLKSWPGWTLVGLVIQTAISIVVLRYALDGSVHSDGTLVAAAAGIEFVAFAAFCLLRAHLAASYPATSRR